MRWYLHPNDAFPARETLGPPVLPPYGFNTGSGSSFLEVLYPRLRATSSPDPEAADMLMPGMTAAQLPTAQDECVEGLQEGEAADFDEALTAYLQIIVAGKVRL